MGVVGTAGSGDPSQPSEPWPVFGKAAPLGVCSHVVVSFSLAWCLELNLTCWRGYAQGAAGVARAEAAAEEGGAAAAAAATAPGPAPTKRKREEKEGLDDAGLKDIMMTRKNRKLYQSLQKSKAAKQARVEALHRKRQQLEGR